MKKTIGIIVVLLVIAVILISINKKDSTETIKIGGAFILSGPQALIGDFQKNAATMAVDEINAQGGIDGNKVELLLEDSTYDPKTAVSAYQALKLRGAKFIIADGSPVVAAIREIVVKDGNLLFAPGATTSVYFDGSNLSCRIALTARNFGPGFVQLAQNKGYKNLVTLFPDNEYGRGLFDELNKGLVTTGGKVVVSEFYNAGTGGGDYRTNITKLKAKQTEADALIVVQVANTVEPMLTQIRELGWTKPILSDYYTIQNPAMKNLTLANGIDYIDYQYSRDVSPTESEATKKFKADYTAKFNAAPVFLGAGHYDVTKLIIEGIKNAGDDPQKVANYISSLKDYEGVTGKLSFNSDCEVSRDLVYRTVKEGKIVDLE